MDTDAKLHAPGLNRITRPGGVIERYWFASRAAKAAGFTPRTVRIPDAADDGEAALICRRMQFEQGEFLNGSVVKQEDATAGTIAWLCTQFETDPDSPYRDKRSATQRFYSVHIRRLAEKIGPEHVDEITGRDVRRWHREWKQELGDRTAYACIQTLRRVVKYGVADLSYDPCIKLSRILSEVTFQQPAARKRKAMFGQVVALRKAAHDVGEGAIALAVTLQFELGLRQKDVIGEWTHKLARGANRHLKGPRRSIDGWEWGLTWAHIDAAFMLVKPTSKSNGTSVAEHDLRAHPDVMAELERIPPERRVGPVVIDPRTGLPFRPEAFRRRFRVVARAAGWPDDLWNMDNRAGAVSEAFEAGADPADVMRAATHKQLSTTMRYNRSGAVPASRVINLRLARRKAEGGT